MHDEPSSMADYEPLVDTDCRNSIEKPGNPHQRRTICSSDAILVEVSARAADRPIGSSYSPETQIVLPYQGAFSWRVGGATRLVDANSILFVRAGEEFLEAHPIKNVGHGSVIITPSEATKVELGLDNHPIFSCVTSPVPDDLRLCTHALIAGMARNTLAREEVALRLVAAIVGLDHAVAPVRSIVRRAKEVIHAHACDFLSLDDLSTAVGVTPLYLTQVFSKVEGIPLYRYQMRLRLSRALLELPSRESLTELALDLGFSSHSHFTSTFRKAFEITPSNFRAAHRQFALRR